jgi:hypothetical protein
MGDWNILIVRKFNYIQGNDFIWEVIEKCYLLDYWIMKRWVTIQSLGKEFIGIRWKIWDICDNRIY